MPAREAVSQASTVGVSPAAAKRTPSGENAMSATLASPASGNPSGLPGRSHSCTVPSADAEAMRRPGRPAANRHGICSHHSPTLTLSP